MIDIIPAVVWGALPDGSNCYVNGRFVEYTGMSPEQLAGSGWHTATHPHDLPGYVDQWRVSVETGNIFEREVRFRRADGKYRWHLCRGEPLRGEGGNIVRWYGLLTDIEDRKRAEEALRRSEAYLSDAQRLSHSGVSAHNETAVLYGSEETYRIWGFDPAQGVPSLEAVRQRIHPDDRSRMRAEVQRALDEKRGYAIGYRIVLPDGTVKHLESRGQPAFSASGELVEIITTQIDMTERRRSEEALRRSEAYLSDSQRLSHTGSWAFSATGFDYWSSELFRIHGLDPSSKAPTTEEYLGLVHPEDREFVAQKIQKLLGDHCGFDFTKRIVRPDGEVRHIRCVGSPMTHGNVFQGFVGSAVDVTEQERFEQERERLHRLEADLAHVNRVSMMGEMAASLAHEVNQPIAAAINDAAACRRWLMRDKPNLEKAQEAARNVVESATRAAEIIDRLRSFYKKGRPPQLEVIDLNEVVREMLMLLRNTADRHAIALRTNLAKLPKVLADRVQLQQVLMNLMLNGIEAMKEMPGELEVTSQSAEDGDVLISVSDTGTGIPADKADQIFTAFFTTKPQGTGMGLAISRSIIESHGGRLWATGNNAGRGATFHFKLPIGSLSPRGRQPSDTSQSASSKSEPAAVLAGPAVENGQA